MTRPKQPHHLGVGLEDLGGKRVGPEQRRFGDRVGNLPRNERLIIFITGSEHCPIVSQGGCKADHSQKIGLPEPGKQTKKNTFI